MAQIKYSYCLDENNELVHISSVSAENRHSHTYLCLECGQPMIAKIGKIKVPHFAHGADTACDGESYLHKLAKRRIRERFMSADSFPLTFTRDVLCQEYQNCPGRMEAYCLEKDVRIPTDLRTWKEKPVYDTCQEEVMVGSFRPDLLLTCSTKPERPPVFIEVYKTHESEGPKVTSEFRIIETMKIKSEADIDGIISKGFIEGENCKTYNFNPPTPFVRKRDIPITRFILFESGAATVYRAVDYKVMCAQLNKRVHPQSIRELNLKGSGMDLWEASALENYYKNIIPTLQKPKPVINLDHYQAGLVYLVKKGLDIKNCILCKFYKYNEWQNTHVCIRYKLLGEQYHFPKQTTARDCPQYEKDPVLMNYPMKELEKEVSEVPI